MGRFVGEQALAAVGASYALTNIFICVAIGGGIGASVIVSRYFGAGEYGRMKLAVYTALLAFLGVSVAPVSYTHLDVYKRQGKDGHAGQHGLAALKGEYLQSADYLRAG